MSKVITFSTRFPATHLRKGDHTLFVPAIFKSLGSDHYKPYPNVLDALISMNRNLPEKLISDFEYETRLLVPQWLDLHPKLHTIRASKRWKTGDIFSPRVWSDKPYNSPQIIIAPDIALKRVCEIEINSLGFISIDGKYYAHIHNQRAVQLANNDGLSIEDFAAWFDKIPFYGQILIWSDKQLPY